MTATHEKKKGPKPHHGKGNNASEGLAAGLQLNFPLYKKQQSQGPVNHLSPAFVRFKSAEPCESAIHHNQAEKFKPMRIDVSIFVKNVGLLAGEAQNPVGRAGPDLQVTQKKTAADTNSASGQTGTDSFTFLAFMSLLVSQL
ncbi:hypothetical protein PoB_002626000 [Plakobranchus ocellatus]|uniref:Uncharacterized protein n=1 Tax=Plakobranchus ocellatus TaxID=259542 RepID=A0AAV3ZV70_9GAST|nr:hypothetical protein PoB_002626000 [Plakobranchus ocellatus]